MYFRITPRQALRTRSARWRRLALLGLFGLVCRITARSCCVKSSTAERKNGGASVLLVFTLMALTVPSVNSLGAMGVEQCIPAYTSFPLNVYAGICKVNANFLDSNHIHVETRDCMNKVFMFGVFGVNRKAT